MHQFSAALIGEFRIGLSRQTTSLTQEDYGQDLSQEFGIPGVNRSPQTSGLSSLLVSGLFSVGDSLLTPLKLAATDWTMSGKITWVKGRQVLRTGFEYQNEMGSAGYLVYGRGYYTFLNLSTSTAVGAPRRIRICQFPDGRTVPGVARPFTAGHGRLAFLTLLILCAV